MVEAIAQGHPVNPQDKKTIFGAATDSVGS